MAESQRPFHRKETRTPLFEPRVKIMRCYFTRSGRIVDVEILSGLSDEEAVAKARLLFSEHAGPLEGFAVWERARVIFRHHPDPKNPSGKAHEATLVTLPGHTPPGNLLAADVL